MPRLDSPERLKEKCAERKANRRPPGRPKGGSLAIQQYEKMEEENLEEALAAAFAVVKDPDHKNWAAALKFLGDRSLHVSHFEKGGHSTPVVNINIGSAAGVEVEGEVIENDDRPET